MSRLWVRRCSVSLAAIMALVVGIPTGMDSPQGGSRFPLAGLWELLTTRPAWSLDDPVRPKQKLGNADRVTAVSADATRANGGSGKPRVKVPGAAEDYKLRDDTPDTYTTGTKGKFDPATSRRIAAEATQTSDMYENADGSFTRRSSGSPVNFKDQNGNWQPIDTKLVQDKDGRWKVAASAVGVSLAGFGDGTNAYSANAAERSTAQLAEIVLPTGEAFGFTLEGALLSEPKVSGSTAMYRDVLPFTDLSVDALDIGVKETIILRSAAAANSWEFQLDLKGLTARLGPGGQIELVNASGAVAAVVPPGFMEDSNVDPASAEGKISQAVRYELIEGGGETVLRITADRAWLDDPARVFPVKVDPTTLLQNASGSAFVSTSWANSDTSGMTEMKIGKSPGDGQLAFGLLKFADINTTYKGMRMSWAQINFNVMWTGACPGSSGATFHIYEVTSPWTPSGVRWGNQPSGGREVAGGTGYPDDPVCANTTPSPEAGTWWSYEFNGDGMDVLNGWSSGQAVNHGISLATSYGGAQDWVRVSSLNTSRKPSLYLTYTPNQLPVVTDQFPKHGYNTPTLTPELLVKGSDPDRWPYADMTYQFIVKEINGEQLTDVADSGNFAAATRWTVPAGKLVWGKTYVWTAAGWDGDPRSIPATGNSWNVLSTAVPQPAITSALSDNGPQGFAPNIGNYTKTATDAQVASPGPALAIQRTYNSRDPRTSGVFGTGWSSVLDAKAVESGSFVVVTYPSGQDVAFGLNPDGTYVSPSGRYATLTKVGTTGFSLVDKSGTRYLFTHAAGSVFKIRHITDAAGNNLSFDYDGSGNVTSMIGASGRKLAITVSDGRITRISNAASEDWTYTYSSNTLTKVCSPASLIKCATYSYKSTWSHPAAVLGSQPYQYFRLDDTSGTQTQPAVDHPNAVPGTYSNVTLGQAGIIPEAGKSALFNGTSSYMELPVDFAQMSSTKTVSLWFKTTGAGVLYGYQNSVVTATPTAANPALFVDTDKKLRGGFWGPQMQAGIVSNTDVADGLWHHAALSASGSAQSLYLDGVLVGSLSFAIDPSWSTKAYVGAGWWGGWLGSIQGSTVGYFPGSISDFALYTSPLSAGEISSLSTTGRTASKSIGQITRPSTDVEAKVDYKAGTNVVTQVIDSNNGVWAISDPAYSGSSRPYMSAVMASAPADYFRLENTGNQVNGGVGHFTNVTFGSAVAGPLGDTAGLKDTAASFNGSTSQMELFNDNTKLNDTSDDTPNPSVDTSKSFSLSAWANLTANNRYMGIVAIDGHQDHAASIFNSPSGTFGFQVCANEVFPACVIAWAPSATPVNTWVHLVGTYDKANQKISLYLDGNLAGTATATAVFKAQGALSIGNYKWFGIKNSFVEGRIAEVATFRHALTESEVKLQLAGRDQAKATGTPAKKIRVAGPLTPAITVANFDGTVYHASAGKTWVSNGMRLVFQGDGNLVLYRLDTGGPTWDSGTWGNADADLVFQSDGNMVIYKDSVALWASGTNGQSGNVAVLRPFGDFVINSASGAQVWSRGVQLDLPGVTTYTYDVLNGGRLIEELDPRGGKTIYGYDVNGFQHSKVDQNGNVAITEFDKRGNAIAQVTCQDQSDDDCSTSYSKYLLDPLNGSNPCNDRLEEFRDARSSSDTDNAYLTKRAYDGACNQTSITDPLGRVTSTQYSAPPAATSSAACAAGETPDKAFDSAWSTLTTKWCSLAADRWLRADFPYVRPLQQIVIRHAGYGGESASLNTKDFDIAVSVDATNWTTVAQIRGNTASVTTTQLPPGTVAKQIKLFVITATSTADIAARIYEIEGVSPRGLPEVNSLPNGAAQRIEYSGAGDVIKTVDAAGLVTAYEYDIVGRLSTSTVKADGGDLVTTYEYDKLGRVVKQTEPPVTDRVNGPTHTKQTVTTFNDDGLVISSKVSDPTGGDVFREVKFGYTKGLQTSQTDALNQVSTIEYDLSGRPVKVTKPGSPPIQIGYDDSGNKTITKILGWTGDPNFPSAPTDLVTETRAYDPGGRLGSVVDAMGFKTEYRYTDNNLLASVTRVDGASSFIVESNTYDDAGNLKSKATNNGSTTTAFAIDAASRVSSQTMAGVNRTATFTYGLDDSVVSTKISDAAGQQIVDRTYDLAGRMLSENLSRLGNGSLAGRWLLDGNASDASGNSPGTHGTDVTYSADHGGSAVFTAGGSITTPAPVIDTSQSYTVAAWVKLDAKNWWRYAVSADGQTVPAFELGYDYGSDRWRAFTCDADVTPSQTQCPQATSSQTAQAGTWTHLAATVDVPNLTIKLYVNGVLDSTASFNRAFKASGPMVIGGGIWDGYHGGGWPGNIDDVQAYQSLLPAGNIQQIKEGTWPGNVVTTRTSWQLDNRGLPKSSVDPMGNKTYFEFDSAGHQTSSTSPSVASEENGSAPVTAPIVNTLGYNTFGEKVAIRDGRGHVAAVAYDANGQPIQTMLPSYTPPGSLPLTPVTKTEYYPNGLVKKTIDPLDNATSYVYDQLGRVGSVTAPDNGVSRFTYTLNGQQASVTDATGIRADATYDYLGNKLTTTQTSFTTNISYDASGRLATVTPPGPGRNPTTYTYNAVGEVTKVVDGAGIQTEFGYDFAGRKVFTKLADASMQTVRYNEFGWPDRQENLDAAGSVYSTSSVSYDGSGRPLTATDARDSVTRFTYDALGRMTQLVEPISTTDSIISTFGYDTNSNRTRFTNGRGNAFITKFNPWNLPVEQVEPGAAPVADRTFVTAYDKAGRPVSQSLPGGVSTSSTYDVMGRVKTVSGTGAEVSTTSKAFDYDLAGRLTSASGPGGTNTIDYDNRGFLESVSGPSGASSFAYTPDGLLASRTDAAGTTTYGYDAGSRLNAVSNPDAGLQVAYAYNNLSQVSQITYGTNQNRRVLSYQTNGSHLLSSDELKTSGGASLGKISYTWDKNGNVATKNTTGFAGAGDNTYTYDLANRLTSWNGQSYGWDKAGNRVTANGRTFTYNERNVLTSSSDGTTYGYTMRGTLLSTTIGSVSKATQSDAFGQVIRQYSTDTAYSEYEYDGFGRMVKPGFSYSGLGNTLAADPTTKYVRGPADNLLCVTNGGGTGVYAWTDLHADVVAQFGAASTALNGSATYDPFGKVLSATGMQGNLGYQSGWTDSSTGRVNMHARWYNSDTGQFDSRDTSSNNPSPSSVNANRFAYANSNPMRFTDPSGHYAIDDGLDVSLATTNHCASYHDSPGCSAGNTSQVHTTSGKRSTSGKGSGLGTPAPYVPGSGCLTNHDADGATAADPFACVVQAPCIRNKQVDGSSVNDRNACVLTEPKDIPPTPGSPEWIRQQLDTPIFVDIDSTGLTRSQILDLIRSRGYHGSEQMTYIDILIWASDRDDNWRLACSLILGLADSGECDYRPKEIQDLYAASNRSVPWDTLLLELTGVADAKRCITDSPEWVEGCIWTAVSIFGAYAWATKVVKGMLISGRIARVTGTLAGAGVVDLSRFVGRFCSFGGYTPVLMADGSAKAIEQIKVGEEVRATDPNSGTAGSREITALWVHVDNVVLLAIEGKLVQTTEDHPFWNQTDHAWQRADQLDRGDAVLSADGTTALVEGVRAALSGPYLVYNLTVADIHTYYVLAGNQPVLVHNCKLSESLKALATKHITGSGDTVIGPFDDYTIKAEHRGASYFAPGDVFGTLTTDQQEALEKHFLDIVANRGDRVLLAIPKSDIRPGSWTQFEVDYLKNAHGYKWVNQWSLVKEG